MPHSNLTSSRTLKVFFGLVRGILNKAAGLVPPVTFWIGGKYAGKVANRGLVSKYSFEAIYSDYAGEVTQELEEPKPSKETLLGVETEVAGELTEDLDLDESDESKPSKMILVGGKGKWLVDCIKSHSAEKF